MIENLIDKQLIEEILAVITVYGPLNEKEIIEYAKKYFSHAFTKEDEENMEVYLESLIAVNRIYKVGKKYSSLTSDAIKTANEEMKDIILAIGDTEKKYQKDELIKYANVDKLNGIKEFDDLKKYYDSLSFKDKKDKDELFLGLCFGTYSCFDVNGVIDELNKVTNNLNKDKLIEHLTGYSGILPRPFLHGYTYKDINSMEDELKENLSNKLEEELSNSDINEFFTTKHKVKSVDKKKYGKFTYEECIELTKKVNKSQIFKLIDSDKVLELLINGKPVYIEILGYYGKDKAILIFKSREDMINTHSMMASGDTDEYPDMALHVHCIEVSESGTDFLDYEMIDELKEKNLPLEPNFSVLDGYKGMHLPSQDELNLIGAVLSDIVKLFQIANLSDIKMNLGEENDRFDIHQVYVGDNEVRYGNYNDIEFGDTILDFYLDNIRKKNVDKLVDYEESEILIGTYILDAYLQDINEHPHIIILMDKKKDVVIDYFFRSSKDIKGIKNDVLKVFDKHKIKPSCIYVNNDYCYEIFDEFEAYYELDYDEEGALNNFYRGFREEAIDMSNVKDSLYS